MIDALPSEPSKDREATARQLHGRLIVCSAAALVIMAAAVVWRISNGPHATPAAPAPVASAAPVRDVAAPAKDAAAAPARDQVLEALVETTKALQISQQQAIDQLQVLQDQLASEQAEAKKSSDQVAALGDKVETLRQSFASVAAQPAEVDTPEREPARARHRAHHRGSATRTARR
jgi:hypothetical protein